MRHDEKTAATLMGVVTLALVLAKRFILFALIWLVLSRGESGGFMFGAAAAAGAASASLALLPPTRRRISIIGVIGLVPGFLRSSLEGGIDVARRVLHPSMPLDAGWIAYHTKLPKGLSRVSFGSETSLLPGSLVAGGRGDTIYVHCLDRGQDVESNLRKEEARIAAALTEAKGLRENGA